MPHHEPAPDTSGFHGDVAGLTLADVIQLNGNNGFSGCITIRQGSKVGRIFFREGKLVHAEQDGKSGEEAFYEIMEWRSGHFSLEPNISTTSHSIQRSTQFVLMEAHRLMDERRAGREEKAPEPAATDSAAGKAGREGLGARLRSVPGVRHAVLAGRDGASSEGSSPEAEVLAGKAAYLAMVAHRVGEALGAGEAKAISVRRTTEHLLVLASKTSYLAVLIDGAKDLGTVEPEILKALNRSP